jgi:hypothetical protein
LKASTLCALALVLVAGPARAQTEPPSRPGPWVLDVHGVTSPVPQDPAFYPPLDPSALVPARGFGLDIGSHVYLFDLGAARFGVGASLSTIRSTAKPTVPATAPGATPAPAGQSLALHLMYLAPHVSLNFGSRGGWSYLSGGMGAAMVRTTTTGVSPGERETAPLWEFDRLWKFQDYNMLHVGGGARWFAKPRMAFSFDLRLYRVSPGTAGAIVLAVPPVPPPVAGPPVPTPGMMQFTVGAGLSFR